MFYAWSMNIFCFNSDLQSLWTKVRTLIKLRSPQVKINEVVVCLRHTQSITLIAFDLKLGLGLDNNMLDFCS